MGLNLRRRTQDKTGTYVVLSPGSRILLPRKLYFGRSGVSPDGTGGTPVLPVAKLCCIHSFTFFVSSCLGDSEKRKEASKSSSFLTRGRLPTNCPANDVRQLGRRSLYQNSHSEDASSRPDKEDCERNNSQQTDEGLPHRYTCRRALPDQH